MEFKDYYAILGVPRDADAEAIKKAFRTLARKYHPDVAKGLGRDAAAEKFKEINEAYEVLSDPAKRQKYDRLGAAWDQPDAEHFQQAGSGTARPGTGAYEFHFEGTGFSDFFEKFFGGLGGMGDFTEAVRNRRAGSAAAFDTPLRGEDMEGSLLITLEEALKGSIREVQIRRRDPQTGQTTLQTFKVRIPPGARDGQVVRLAGKGGEGWNGGAPGDLFLHIRIASHPDFRLEGANLYYDLPLAPWEAVLGTKAEIPTLDGPIRITIPPGTTSGRVLRVRGRGLYREPGGSRADLFVVVRIDVPSTVSEQEKAAWQKLQEISRFNPRQ